MRDGLEELEYGSEDDPFTEELLAVIEKAREFAENGDGNNAMSTTSRFSSAQTLRERVYAILETITTTYAEEWEELTNYGGDCYSIAEPLNSAWTEAILCAKLTEAEVIDLQVMLESWQDEIDVDFAMMSALYQGWNAPLQRVMKGESAQIWADNRPDFANDLALIRLQILERP